jgi:AcrR family transcriptional regulator
MARKTKEESDLTRKRILFTALDLFFENGYAHTTLNDIAKTCGLTRGAIYWHFKDKADLFMALGRHIDYNGIDINKILNEPSLNLKELLNNIIYYFSKLESDNNYWKFYCLIHYKIEWNVELEPLLVQFREEYKGMLNALRLILERLKVDGSLRNNINTEDVALGTMAFIEGLIGMWFFDPKIFSLKQTGSKLVGDYLRQFSM